MPDKATYDILISHGIRADVCPFMKNDSLASEKDLTELFNVLTSFVDKHGHHPVITANCVLANPDFDRIRDSGFTEYYYENFTDTLKRYPDHSSSFNLWKKGIENGLFFPQFHGREHLNIKRWLNALKENLPLTRFAFDLRLFGISTTVSAEIKRSYLAAFDSDDGNDELYLQGIIGDGIRLFNEIFDYNPVSFIAPNYVWNSKIEKTLSSYNVQYIKGLRKQIIPDTSSGTGYKLKPHFTGQLNPDKQLYIVRNCFFEPSLETANDSVLSCLSQIQNSFLWRRPAVISTHRVNYIGSIVPMNRERGLKKLNELLTGIKQRWPDAEYLTSSELGNLIKTETHYHV